MGSRRSENNDRSTEQFRKLFIGGLALTTTEEKLKSYYERWGELVDVVVMKERGTNRSRGFGFVTFRDPEMLDAAQADRPHEIDGKHVETKRAMPREDSCHPESHMTVNRLFVGKLAKDVTADDLREYFSQFGSVTDCEIVTWKESGEPRGFGFVTFDDYDPVDKAILYKPHQIRNSRAEVKKALSKEQINEMKRKQDYDRQGMMRSSQRGGFPQMGGMDMYDDGYGGAYAMPQVAGGRQMDKWVDDGRYANYGAQVGGYDASMAAHHAAAAAAAGWGASAGGVGGHMGGGRVPAYANNGYEEGDRFGQYGAQRRYGGGPIRGGASPYGQRSAPYRGYGAGGGPSGGSGGRR